VRSPAILAAQSIRTTGRALCTVAGMVVNLLAVLLLGFLLFRVLPGDPVTEMTRGRPVTPEQLAQLRDDFGLDDPLPGQVIGYLGGIVHGDLGISYEYQQPVLEVIAGRLWPTALLVGTAMLLAVAVGLWSGTRAGWRPRSRFDAFSTGTALVLWSVPVFWLGLILLVVMGAGAGPFPALCSPSAGCDLRTPRPGFGRPRSMWPGTSYCPA
jgi:peptide/nickel transport system permease protein